MLLIVLLWRRVERIVFVILHVCSQSLVNLLLTGTAVTNVFDLDKDVSGLSE